MSKVLLQNIEAHLKDGESKHAIETLVSALDKKRDLVLPVVLKEKLDQIKITPIDEKAISLKQKEIEEMLKSGELDEREAPIELLETIFTAEEFEKLHASGITFAEFQLLGREIKDKVFDFKHLDEKGNLVYKEVDSHKDMAVLTFLERKDMRKAIRKTVNFGIEINKKLQEATKLNNSDSEGNQEKITQILAEVKEIQNEVEVATKNLTEKALELSKLDKKTMTEWEQNLAVAKVIEMADDRYTPPAGKK
jgi:hypothetical protein